MPALGLHWERRSLMKAGNDSHRQAVTVLYAPFLWEKDSDVDETSPPPRFRRPIRPVRSSGRLDGAGADRHGARARSGRGAAASVAPGAEAGAASADGGDPLRLRAGGPPNPSARQL